LLLAGEKKNGLIKMKEIIGDCHLQEIRSKKKIFSLLVIRDQEYLNVDSNDYSAIGKRKI
jgi:hypothetical protein